MSRFIQVWKDGIPILVNADKITYMHPQIDSSGVNGTEVYFDHNDNIGAYHVEIEEKAGTASVEAIETEGSGCLWLDDDFGIVALKIERTGAPVVYDSKFKSSGKWRDK